MFDDRVPADRHPIPEDIVIAGRVMNCTPWTIQPWEIQFETPNPVFFTSVKAANGWLGNMSAYPITMSHPTGYVRGQTAEHVFQALRFPPGPERETVLAPPSPMAAKMVAKKLMKHRPDEVPLSDVETMASLLRLKILQHPSLKELLLQTTDRVIIEDVSARPQGRGLFWGAKQIGPASWVGCNVLGKLWMEVRLFFQEGRVQ